MHMHLYTHTHIPSTIIDNSHAHKMHMKKKYVGMFE